MNSLGSVKGANLKIQCATGSLKEDICYDLFFKLTSFVMLILRICINKSVLLTLYLNKTLICVHFELYKPEIIDFLCMFFFVKRNVLVLNSYKIFEKQKYTVISNCWKLILFLCNFIKIFYQWDRTKILYNPSQYIEFCIIDNQM